jgi:protein AFG1
MAGFLDSLKARCEVVELDGGRDYRGGVEGVEVEERVKWFTDNSAGFELAWNAEIEGKQGEFVQCGRLISAHD